MRKLKTLILFVFVFLLIASFFLYYLSSRDVIFRGQRLVLGKDKAFAKACEKAAATRRKEAQKHLSKLFEQSAWFRYPETTLILPANASLNESLLKLKSDKVPRPWKIILEPGMRNEVITLDDKVTLIGKNRQDCGFKCDGRDFGEHHNIICYVPENAHCHLENLTLYNTLRDYPSQAIEISEGAQVQFVNCALLSQGNDTLTIRKDASVCAFGCSIRGNSDCISAHADADFWNCFIDSRFRDGSRALWLGSRSHLYLEDCIIRSVNGAIQFSDIKRTKVKDPRFVQQVTLINCVLTRKAHHGRTFSIAGPLDGMLYRHTPQAPGVVHIEGTTWLESEMGATGQQYLHKIGEKKAYAPR